MFVFLAPPRLDSEMPEGVEIMNSTLVFLRPLQRNDSGVYRCEVANDINLRSRDVRILIQGEHTGRQLTPTVGSSLRKLCACMHVIPGYHCLWHRPSSWNVTLCHTHPFCTYWQSIKNVAIVLLVGTDDIWPFNLVLILCWLALITARPPDVWEGGFWAKQLKIFKSYLDCSALPLLCPLGIWVFLVSVVYQEHVSLVSQNLSCLPNLSSWIKFSIKTWFSVTSLPSSSAVFLLFLHMLCSKRQKPAAWLRDDVPDS